MPQWKTIGQLLQECLQELGFKPSFAESPLYMKKYPTADHYKYVATYADNSCKNSEFMRNSQPNLYNLSYTS